MHYDSESNSGSPRSLFYDSERSASTHSLVSSDGEQNVHPRPQERSSLFASVDYLDDALKLDMDGAPDSDLNDLIDMYHSNVIVTSPSRAAIPHVDTIGEEDEMEYVQETRYSTEEKAKSVASPTSPRSETSSLFAPESVVLPPLGLTREDIVFQTATRASFEPTIKECQDSLVQAFPSLVEPAARMFGEDGTPLPPTKKEEYSEEEKLARKDALKVNIEGKKVHSLLKAVLVLESRHTLWKKIGSAPDVGHSNEQPLALLPDLPNPWDMEITHSGLDISSIRGKTRKILELPRSRMFGSCRKCTGSGSEACRTCRGEAGNECFWCSGSGIQKGRRKCGRCQGQGVLSCMACEGKKASPCRSCDGAGCGEYMGFVEIKMRRVEVPAVAVADLVGPGRVAADVVRTASVDMLWELVKTLAAKASLKSKRPYLPVSAVCTWQQSVSHLAEVTALQAAKFKKGSKTPFKPEGLRSTIPTKTRYFSLPNDPSLPISELTHDQFLKQNAPDEAVKLPETGVKNVSKRLSVMLMGHVVDTPSSSAYNSPMGSVNSSPVIQRESLEAVFEEPPSPSPKPRPMSRPMSPLHAPPAHFNSEELRIRMLRHASSQSLRLNISRPISAPGIPL